MSPREKTGLRILACCLFAACSFTAHSAESAICSEIVDKTERLACFDAKTEEPDPYQAAKDLVRAELRDPASATFRDVFVSTYLDQNGNAAICGWVNAKNQFGGYVGFRKFYALNGGSNIVGDGDADLAEFDEKLWNIVCKTRAPTVTDSARVAS